MLRTNDQYLTDLDVFLQIGEKPVGTELLADMDAIVAQEFINILRSNLLRQLQV